MATGDFGMQAASAFQGDLADGRNQITRRLTSIAAGVKKRD